MAGHPDPYQVVRDQQPVARVGTFFVYDLPRTPLPLPAAAHAAAQ